MFFDLTGIKTDRDTRGRRQHWHAEINRRINRHLRQKRQSEALWRTGTQRHQGYPVLARHWDQTKEGKTKWIMGTGEISWPDKLIVLPFSAVRPAPQQEAGKGKARGATLRHTASYHKELLIHLHKQGGIAQICNHTARPARTHTPQSHSQSILYVAETECNTTTGISETHTVKKEAFHYRLRVIISTIILLEGDSQSQTYAYTFPPSFPFSHDSIVSSRQRLLSIRSPRCG